MFSKLHSIMSPLSNMYDLLSQERPSNRSVKPPSHLKRLRSIAWHNYKDMRQRYGRNLEIAGQDLIFCYSINDQYRNYHIHHQFQEELFLIDKSSKFFHPYIRRKKLEDLQSDR